MASCDAMIFPSQQDDTKIVCVCVYRKHDPMAVNEIECVIEGSSQMCLSVKILCDTSFRVLSIQVMSIYVQIVSVCTENKDDPIKLTSICYICVSGYYYAFFFLNMAQTN